MNHHQPTSDDPYTFWEAHYRSAAQHRFHACGPNPTLVETATPLAAGSALDLGCGEGGDTLWLAEHGWQVTAVDVSATVLGRVAERAARAGVTDRVRTEQHDLGASFPEGTYDLATAHYLLSPVRLPRVEVLRRAAAAVAPGGLLLAVTHAALPPWAWSDEDSDGHGHGHGHGHMASAEEDWTALALPEAEWECLRLGEQERSAIGPDGQPGTLLDGILLARRTGRPT